MLAPKSERFDIADDGCFLVRVGAMGRVGRFRLAEPTRLSRRDRVVCRTDRGIEVGAVLGPSAIAGQPGQDLADGRILRRMTSEDELLWGHLQQLGQDAHRSCEQWLADRGLSATLLEVEPLLDGKTLYFHFLSDVDDDVQRHLDDLVGLYEQEVRQSKFAGLLEHGCGPGCGTAKASNGCGTRGGCAVCQIASACGAKKTH